METNITDVTACMDILSITFKLKEEVQLICDKLATYGEETIFISTNKIENTSSCRGSTIGLDFIFKKLDVLEQFYSYCRGNSFDKDNIENLDEDDDDIDTTDLDENSKTVPENSISRDVHILKYYPNCQSTNLVSFESDKTEGQDVFQTPSNYYGCKMDEQEIADNKGQSAREVVAAETNNDLEGISEATDSKRVFRSVGSNVDLDMCVSEGEEDIAVSLPKCERSSPEVRDTNLKIIDTCTVAKDTECKVSNADVNTKDSEIGLIKTLKTETDGYSSKKKTTVATDTDRHSSEKKTHSLENKTTVTTESNAHSKELKTTETNKKLLLVPLMKKGMIDLKNKHVMLKKLNPKEKKFIDFDIKKGAKMFIIPVTKKEDLKKGVIDYSAGKTQVKTAPLASGRTIKTETIDVSETENPKTSDKGTSLSLGNKSHPRETTAKGSNKEVKVEVQVKKELPLSESSDCFSLLKNLPRGVEQSEKETKPQTSSVLYSVGQTEMFPVKIKGEPEQIDFHNAGKVIREGDIKSYIMYRKHKTYSQYSKPKKREMYQCTVCKKIYQVKQSLKEHMFSHTGNFPYQCSVCNRKFSKRVFMQNHLNKHLGNKKFMCEVCGKFFASNELLKRHVQIHSDEKSYICEICKKKFLRRQGLTKHMKFHKDEKNYMCEECGKRFFTNNHLKRHIMIHTGVKQYRCELCPYECNQAGNLKIHMKVHKT